MVLKVGHKASFCVLFRIKLKVFVCKENLFALKRIFHKKRFLLFIDKLKIMRIRLSLACILCLGGVAGVSPAEGVASNNVRARGKLSPAKEKVHNLYCNHVYENCLDTLESVYAPHFALGMNNGSKF